jgi:hypothetical protein
VPERYSGRSSSRVDSTTRIVDGEHPTPHRTARYNYGPLPLSGSAERHLGRANSLQVCTAKRVPMQTWFGYPPEDVSPVEASRSR